ncbi:MAG: hypothetical protein QOI61_336 [Actinomycetota bacterium]|jgi:hypothetical protein
MQRAEQRSGLAERLGALFTIGPSQKRFIQELDKANTGAFELVLTPMIFAGIGVFLAGKFGGGLLLPFTLGFIALGGTVYRLIVDYKRRMLKESEGKPWTR